MDHVLNDNISVQCSKWLFLSCCPCIDGTNIVCLICLVQLFGKARDRLRFMYCDGLTLCDVYLMKLIRYGTLTISDAMLSEIYVVLCYVSIAVPFKGRVSEEYSFGFYMNQLQLMARA